MARDMESPVDLPGSTFIGGQPLLWTSVVIATASLFLALTNATTMHGWAVELEPGPVSQRVIDATAQWEALTDRLGLGRPRAAAHAVWKKGQAARF